MLPGHLDWPAFLLAMAIVELTPGPNMGWLAMLSVRQGWRPGLAAVGGITVGLTVQVLAAATGLAALVATIPAAYEGIRWAGVAFMLWLAWEAWQDSGSASPVRTAGLGGTLLLSSFLRGMIANLLNPKALLFYLIIVGRFADPTGPMVPQVLALGLIHLLVASTIHLAIVWLGARSGDALERWRRSQIARALFAGLLVGLALWIGLTTARP